MTPSLALPVEKATNFIAALFAGIGISVLADSGYGTCTE
jgi:hypothetical protein